MATPTWWRTSRRCSATAAWSAPCWSGSSMGAATAMAFALAHPERVPRWSRSRPPTTARRHRATRAAGTARRRARAGGVDAFVEATEPDVAAERWREPVRAAVAPAHGAPRASRGGGRRRCASCRARGRWTALEPLERLEVPVLVVARRDETDPLHPLAVAEEYARRLPHAELVVEDEGKAPLAWQGGAALERDRRLPGAGGYLVEHAAEAHDRRALLDGHRVVLGGAHRQPLQAVLGRQLGQPGEVRRLSSGSSVNGGIVIRPVDRHGAALDEVRQLGRARCPPSTPRRPR